MNNTLPLQNCHFIAPRLRRAGAKIIATNEAHLPFYVRDFSTVRLVPFAKFFV